MKMKVELHRSIIPFNHNLIGWKYGISPDQYNDFGKASYIN